MSEATHTPTPWRAQRGEGHHKGKWVITAKGMGADTPLANLADFDDASEADARLIVSAVNAYAAAPAPPAHADAREIQENIAWAQRVIDAPDASTTEKLIATALKETAVALLRSQTVISSTMPPPAHDDAVVAALEVALKWLGPLQQTTSAGMLPTLQREVAQIEQALKKVRSYG